MMTPAPAAEAVTLGIVTIGARILLRLSAGNEGRQAVHAALRAARLGRGAVVIARLLILTRLLVLTILPVVARLVVVLLAGLLMALLKVTLRIGLLMFARRVRLAATRLRLHDAVVLSVEIVVGALFATAAGLWLLLLIGLVLPELFLRRRDQAEIMFGVLVVVFRRNRVTGRGRIAGKLDVFLGDVIGGASDFHIGAVRFVDARQRIMILAAASAAAIAAPHAMVLVLTVPHSLPFRQSLLKAVSPPDVYTFSIETSETAPETRRCASDVLHNIPFRLLKRESRPAAPCILHRYIA